MILLVGTASSYLSQKAAEYSASSVLVTEENWKSAILNYNVGYTGIEEFTDNLVFLDLLHCVESIIYFPSDDNKPFNLHYPTNTIRGWTEHLLLLASQTTPVSNLTSNLLGNETVAKNNNLFLKLADTRKINSSQLWAVGCSYTYGTGVSISERYPTLISKQLNMPVSHLSLPGTSIEWAADQILRSDIRKGDIVIWGLTAKERKTLIWQGDMLNITIKDYDSRKQLEQVLPKKVLIDEENCQYQSLTHIHQVINYCEKIQANLLLVGLLTSLSDILYLHSLPNFYQCYNRETFFNLDNGDDNLHPGPLQHQQYAREIIKQLQLRNWI